MTYTLPEIVDVGGAEYPIRWDYRAILDICAALVDPELGDQDRAVVVLDIFYPQLQDMPTEFYQEAIEKCFWFIDCGEGSGTTKSPRLVDWEKDFNLIAAPVNRVIGRDIRRNEPLHWWTFIGAYQEIGDCTFAQVVRIRDKKARGKPLDKQDREWYRRNQNLVDFKRIYTSEEKDILKEWGGV